MSFVKKEFNIALPMMVVFAAMSLASLHGVSLDLSEAFLDFTLNRMHNTTYSSGLIVNNFRMQMWMVFWVIALVFLQFSGTDALFAASLPIKQSRIIITRFIFGLCAFIPGVVMSSIYMIHLRKQNLDFLTDSVAYWPENIHQALTASFSVTAIIYQALLLTLALTAMYTLILLINVVIRNRIVAAGVSFIALFYIQLLLESISSAFYHFGAYMNDRLWDFAILLSFPNLADNEFTRVSRGFINIHGFTDRSDDLIARLLPIVSVYGFDAAVLRLCVIPVIIALMLFVAVKLHQSPNTITKHGIFVFRAVPVILVVCFVALAAFTVAPMAAKSTPETNNAQRVESPLPQSIAALRLEEERFHEMELDPYKHKILESMKVYGATLDSYRNVSLRASSAEQLQECADALEGAGITGFSDFVRVNKNSDSEDYMFYKDPNSNTLIACRFSEHRTISVYPNHIVEIPSHYAELTSTLEENGLFLSSLITGGVMDELRFIDMSFFEIAQVGFGISGKVAPINEYIIYARNGEIEKVKVISGNKANPSASDAENINWFCRLVGFEYNHSNTVRRYMYQHFYQWIFTETSLTTQA